MKTVTLKEYSTRIKGEPYTFKLNLDNTGVGRLVVLKNESPLPFSEMERDDVVGEHLRDAAAEFIAGKQHW